MTDPNPELSLADVTWLTALARTLTRDGALADDLVQDTWLAARKSPPPTGVNRPWLARVLQRLHGRFRRTETRRTSRQQAASSSKALTGPAELIERAELQRTLADCLLSLEEPFRSTLMHVAFEERTPKEIADGESVSVASVRRRLRKARELLKQKLEREYGREWKQWYAALLPFAELPLPGEVAVASAASSSVASSTQLALGGLLVSKTVLVSIAATPLIGLAIWVGTTPWNEPLPPIERAQTGRPDVAVAAASTIEPTVPLQRELKTPATNATGTIPAAATDTVVVRGTVTIKDESGARWTRANGEFEMEVSNGKEEDAVRVPVIDGAWELELTGANEWTVQPYAGLTLDGRGGMWTGHTQTTILEDTQLDLTAEWIATHRIDVLDAESRQHLSWVQITERVNDTFGTPGVVEEDRVVFRDANSPIQITPDSRYESTFYVGCKGYAWSSVNLDLKKGGRTEVLLQRGADLTVRFAPPRKGVHSGPAHFRITVADKPAREWAVATNTKDMLRLDGLLPGRFVLEARAHRTASIVRREVEILEGPNDALLTIPEFDQEMVAVAGTLIAPKRFDQSHVLRFDQIVPPTNSREHPWNTSGAHRVVPIAKMKRKDEELRFNAGKLPVGSYRVRVCLKGTMNAAWQTDCDIAATGATDLRFSTPTIGVAYVRAFDAQSLEVITPKTATLGAFFSLDRKVQTSFDQEKQAWRLAASPGRVQGKITTLDHAQCAIDVELLVAQPTETKVYLQRRAYLSITLFDREEIVSPGQEWYETCEIIRASTGKASDATLGWSGSGQVFNVKEPGTFLVKFPPLEGYLPIPDQTVVISKGQPQRVRVTLLRSQ